MEPAFSLATPDMKFYSSQHKKRKMLQKKLIVNVWKTFKETSMMESVLLKLQAYNATDCNPTMRRFPRIFFKKCPQN